MFHVEHINIRRRGGGGAADNIRCICVSGAAGRIRLYTAGGHIVVMAGGDVYADGVQITGGKAGAGLCQSPAALQLQCFINTCSLLFHHSLGGNGRGRMVGRFRVQGAGYGWACLYYYK